MSRLISADAIKHRFAGLENIICSECREAVLPSASLISRAIHGMVLLCFLSLCFCLKQKSERLALPLRPVTSACVSPAGSSCIDGTARDDHFQPLRVRQRVQKIMLAVRGDDDIADSRYIKIGNVFPSNRCFTQCVDKAQTFLVCNNSVSQSRLSCTIHRAKRQGQYLLANHKKARRCQQPASAGQRVRREPSKREVNADRQQPVLVEVIHPAQAIPVDSRVIAAVQREKCAFHHDRPRQ